MHLRWISYALFAGGLTAITAGLYLAGADGGSQHPIEASQSQQPTTGAPWTAVAPPGSFLDEPPVATAVPEAASEPIAEEAPPAAPEPLEAHAPPPPPPTAKPQPPAPAATPRPAPPPPPPPPPPPAAPVAAVNLSGMEQSLFSSHNGTRASNGVAGLVLDGTLTQLARQRAQDMASKGYFSHTSPSGQTAFSLLKGSGYAYRMAGENIARNNHPDSQTVSVAMSGFISSPTHRANVLEPAFTHVGVGAAVGADGMKYYAVIFVSK